MGDPKAFLNIPRQEAGYRPVSERITDYSQVLMLVIIELFHFDKVMKTLNDR